jgi:ABC-type transport system involved in cytochrome c biogenesis ATPase subunit
VAQDIARQDAANDEPGRLGRLVAYKIEGLFGRGEISFDLADTGPTLLTGANGSGKSTVLRTIDAVSTGEWARLADIPFSRLTLTFSSGDQIIVNRQDDGLRVERTGCEQFNWTPPVTFQVYPTNLSIPFSVTDIQAAPLTDYGSLITTNVATTTNYQSLWTGFRASSTHLSWIRRLNKDFPVLYVTDDRLLIAGPTSETANAAVDHAAEDIGRSVEMALAEYPQRAQAIDREFPTRVIKAMERDEVYSHHELRELLAAVNVRRDALRSVGLIPEDEAPLEELNLDVPNATTVIRIFAEDTIKKLDTLEPIRKKLELFVDFINHHYRRKQVFIDGKNGAVIVDVDRPEPQIIPPSRLSSGEQQILILAHRVLFSTGEGTLVLIDEPELSLHVLWQGTLVNDLARMGAPNNLAFLLATHSPTLIAGRDDLRRALEFS